MQIIQHIHNKNYDSELCGSIPLHLVNLIQPHGALIILDKSLLNIIQVSENIGTLLGIPVDEILNQPFATIIEAQQLKEIKSKIETWEIKDRIPLTIHFTIRGQQKACNATIHTKPTYVMLEVEPITQLNANTSFIEGIPGSKIYYGSS
jgi:light-regulated signal transduction histidine kinase (bacteriophytochrome)